MKILIILLVSTFSIGNTYSQKIDSVGLKLKAQLLTTSRYGIASYDSLLSDITKQRVIFIKSPALNIILLKVHFSQKYFIGGDGGHIQWLSDCYYYLAFNIKKNKFYRIGGFEILDLRDFFQDLKADDYGLFGEAFNKTSEINFLCLRDYNELSPKRQLKQRTCLPACDKVLTTELIINKAK